MNEATATFLSALVGFIGGALVAREVHLQKADELFFTTLQFFEGGTQKRNLGVCAIQLFRKYQRHRPMATSVMLGAASYLLTESKMDNASHEYFNLIRIMELLLNSAEFTSVDSRQYCFLKSMIDKKRDDQLKNGESRGISVPNELLEEWSETIELFLIQYRPSKCRENTTKDNNA